MKIHNTNELWPALQNLLKHVYRIPMRSEFQIVIHSQLFIRTDGQETSPISY